MNNDRAEFETMDAFRKAVEWSSEYLLVDHLRAPVNYRQFVTLLDNLEAVIPDTKLDWLATSDPNNPEHMTDRRERLRVVFPEGGDNLSVTVINYGSKEAVQVNNLVTRLDSGTVISYEVFFLLPRSLSATISKVLEAIGEALNPYFISWTPPADKLILSYQLYDSWRVSDVGAAYEHLSPVTTFISKVRRCNLPRLQREGKINSCLQLPDVISWVNYWSPETCEMLGFPNSATDDRLLQLSHRTARGAWLVKLTEEIFDVTRPDHMEALEWAYRRFDKIGVRVP